MILVDELIDHAIGFARRVLIGVPDATLTPCWLIQGANGNTIVGTPFNGDWSKDMAAAAIRKLLKKERAVAYSFVSEAWQSVQNAGEPLIRPSNREDRREIVMVTAYDRNGGKMRSWEIIRGPDGVVTELKADSPIKGAEYEGRFFNLFDES